METLSYKVIVKNRKWIPLIIGFVGLFFIFNSCTKTSSAYKYQLGWNGDHAYIIKVQGVWDRSSYYVEGGRKNVSDLGKIAVSSFELRRQAELFARTRALFAFQEAMEDYFNDIENYETEVIEEDSTLEAQEEEVIEENPDGEVDKIEELEELKSENVDTSLVTITQASQSLTASNEEVNVFYEDPNQVTETPLLVEEAPIELEESEESKSEPTPATPVQTDPKSQIKKTINFQQVYNNVHLKITLINKTYTKQDDVEIVYLFSGKNLKQELASAFNISSGAIELRK